MSKGGAVRVGLYGTTLAHRAIANKSLEVRGNEEHGIAEQESHPQRGDLLPKAAGGGPARRPRRSCRQHPRLLRRLSSGDHIAGRPSPLADEDVSSDSG